ncbi:MAG: hypothetical protein AAF939_11830 [Planctomycetota bacterium]
MIPSEGIAMNQATQNPKTGFQFWLTVNLILILICAAFGSYFCFLQDLLYTHYQPFFDSLSYYNEVHAVMTTGRQTGWQSALVEAVGRENSTVVMPYLLAGILSAFMAPSRHVGVIIQGSEFFVLLSSLFYYWYSIKKLSAVLSSFLLIPFFLTACLFSMMGGMADFRMDLSLYLMFAVSGTWYLICMDEAKYRNFLIFGLAVGVTCLFRATAPVYLIVTLFPVACVDWMRASDRTQVGIGLILATSAAALTSLWFYLGNFETLYYYYFVWNLDANAKLPWAESIQHARFAKQHVGNELIYWFACIYLLMILGTIFDTKNRGTLRQKFAASLVDLTISSFNKTDWRLVWFAIAPVVFLILKGAGVNQFVSIPAVFGILLVFLNPIVVQPKPFESKPVLFGGLFLALICFGIQGSESYYQHSKSDSGMNSMKAHQNVIKLMVDDAKAYGKQALTYDSSHVYYLNPTSLTSVIRYDLDGSRFENQKLIVDDVEIISHQLLSGIVVQSNWEQLDGNEDSKWDILMAKIDRELDYLIVPEPETIRFVEKNIPFNLINRNQREIADHIAESRYWVPVSGIISNNAKEDVKVFANRLHDERFGANSSDRKRR